jgi:hypothetical protein
MNKWSKAIEKVLLLQIDQVPKEWKTAKQIGHEMQRGPSSTRAMLARLIEAKKVEVKKFRIQIGDRLLEVPHYRLID